MFYAALYCPTGPLVEKLVAESLTAAEEEVGELLKEYDYEEVAELDILEVVAVTRFDVKGRYRQRREEAKQQSQEECQARRYEEYQKLKAEFDGCG